MDGPLTTELELDREAETLFRLAISRELGIVCFGRDPLVSEIDALLIGIAQQSEEGSGALEQRVSIPRWMAHD
jgi:hypothetical protein